MVQYISLQIFMAGTIRDMNSMNYASKIEFEYGDLVSLTHQACTEERLWEALQDINSVFMLKYEGEVEIFFRIAIKRESCLISSMEIMTPLTVPNCFASN
ncbi:hypothetical protein E2320_019505 [Naja naja]|nr:hypothetical protein E2320_019505 [Naja naja]